MNAYLLLANGMVFAGQSVGAEGVTVGEVVFATGMVGFQETLTDPRLLWPDHHPDLPPYRQLRL
jgi:Carbamoylphosphate synthase small subunit